MNPRFRIWLKSVGLTEQDYTEARTRADQTGELAVLTVDGREVGVARTYIEWSKAQWAEWAAMLGYQPGKDGLLAHHLAMLAGHSSTDHHRWVAAKYGVPYEPSPAQTYAGGFE